MRDRFRLASLLCLNCLPMLLAVIPGSCLAESPATVSASRQSSVLSLKGIGKSSECRDGRDVYVDGDFAYVGGGYHTNGLIIWDVSDRSRPVLAGWTTQHLNFARGVVVRDGVAYVAGRDSGTFVSIDVRSPERPRELDWVGHKEMVGARGVALHASAPFAYVAVGHLPHNSHRNAALAVIDIRDPSDLKLAALVTDPQITAGGSVYQKDNFLYMSGYRDDAVMVFDLADPAAPKLVNRYKHDRIRLARGISSRGDVLFVSSAEMNSIVALDVSHAPEIREVGVLTDERLAGARGNSLKGSRLFVSAREAGSVAVIEVSDPAAMRITDSFNHPALAQAYGMTNDSHFLYAASAETGSLIVLSVKAE